METGAGRAARLDQAYGASPRLSPPRRRWLWAKGLLSRLYFTMVRRG
ncbi:MAG: hypothetical protein L0216_02610 [Planctomycetales bacterium]|nr:hypothetical protein [Planctomycetales bacterium]